MTEKRKYAASRGEICRTSYPTARSAYCSARFGEIVRILLLNNTEITGGPNGISQIPKPTFFGLEFSRTAREGGWDTFSNFFGLKYDPSDRVIFLYLVALLLVVLSLFVINRLLRMPLGRAWEALREDEIACRSLGLSPRRIKLTAFTISAAFAGFAGTLFAARQGFVSPESFTFAESAFVLAIVVLGGMGSQFAVILAAILLVVSRELMRDFNEYSMLMLGGLMVLMMILLKHAPNVMGCAQLIAQVFKDAGIPQGVYGWLNADNDGVSFRLYVAGATRRSSRHQATRRLY